MHTRTLAVAWGGLVLCAVAGTPRPAEAQRFPFRYSVKVVCGEQRDTASAVVPQRYWTAVNVNNASDTLTLVRKTLIPIPAPIRQQVVRSRPLATDTLPPLAALGTDCADLWARGRPPRPFFEGFVLLESRVSLDVVAVYTVRGAIDVVYVPQRAPR